MKKTEEKWLVLYLPEPLVQYDLDNQTITPLAAPGPAPLLAFDVDDETKEAEKLYLEAATYRAKLGTLARSVDRETAAAIPPINISIYDHARYSGEPFTLNEAINIAVYDQNSVGVMLATYPFTILDRARCEHELGVGSSVQRGGNRRSVAAFLRALELGQIPGILQRGGWVYTTPSGFLAWASSQKDRDWKDISPAELGHFLGMGIHRKSGKGKPQGEPSLQFGKKLKRVGGKQTRFWIIPPLDFARRNWNERMGETVEWSDGRTEWVAVTDSGWEAK